MKINGFILSLVTFSLLNTAYLAAISPKEIIDFESEAWVIDDPNAEVMSYLGQKSLYLTSGNAYLKDVEFKNGVFEVVIAAHGNRGFAGVFFRYQSRDNYELFYLRPHKTGLPDALQYTPIFNGLAAWQLYSNEGYTAAVHIPANRWIHLRVVVTNHQVAFYLDNAQEPAMVSELKRPISKGTIGLWGRFGAANFANFRYEVDSSESEIVQVKTSPVPPGIVGQWHLSPAFTTSEFTGEQFLSSHELNQIEWLPVECESGGLVNISRYRSKATAMLDNVPDNMLDIVIAKATIYSDRNQICKMSFGYSDEISIYLNRQILFTGNSTFRSRDPGFLGIIGLDNDAVYLNLKKGDNEILLAITETFGGWGFMCRLDDMTGLKIK